MSRRPARWSTPPSSRSLLSFLDRRHRLTPRRLVGALAAGVRGVLPVAAVCAAAGIITATTTKTGLGPQVAVAAGRAAPVRSATTRRWSWR